MNTSTHQSRTTPTVLAVLGTFLIMGLLVALMRHYTAAPSPAEDRATERAKILEDFKAVNNAIVENYGWQDKDRGIVRVPVAMAKELVLEEWKNPAQAHSNLMDRAAIAFAPAPKAKPKKSEFE